MTKTFLAFATMTAAALMCLPAQAQTGPGMPTATPKAGATSSTSGAATTGGAVTTAPGQTGAQMGTQMNTQSNTSGSVSGGGVQANTRANADMRSQAQAPMRGPRGNAAEMRMTECLNNAMAQKQPIGSCQR